MLMAVAGLALVACNTEKKDATTTTVDSTVVVETPAVAEPITYGYESTDGKQHFEMTFVDDTRETISLKDVEGNAIYEMKIAVSADGAKWENEEGFFFWTKGETFTFGQGDKNLFEGKEISAPASDTMAVNATEVVAE